MADRIADNADLAVDELKRKARRRLIGAIVLALAAAVILPLLLEKEPKPLGDDVSVQIPPVDEGKFINRLTGRSGDSKAGAKFGAKSEPKAEPKADATETDAKPAPTTTASAAPQSAPVPAPSEATVAASTVPAPKKSPAEAEQKVLSPNAKSPSTSDAKGAPAPAPAAKPDAKPAPVVAATPTAALPTPPAPVASAPAVASAKPEGFAVQLAAFTDDKGANALAGKLRTAGYASTYTEPVETSRGTMWRVRVGGYATRPDADAARAKLKADGWNGLVVTAK